MESAPGLEAHTRAEQSVYPSEQEAWLRVASEWSKLAQTCDHPINGVMGALKRIYSGRSPQFPVTAPTSRGNGLPTHERDHRASTMVAQRWLPTATT